MSTTTMPQVSSQAVDGVRIRYADSGGPQEPTLLLTSPWPESVYAFAPMWATLSKHARLYVTIINGRHDRVVPVANAEFLDQRLPASRLVIIDAGHFVWKSRRSTPRLSSTRSPQSIMTQSSQ